jgi:hypothetical protein
MKLLLYNLLFIIVIVAQSQPSCNSTIEEKINYYNNFGIVLDTNGLNGDYSNCLELNTRLWTDNEMFVIIENKHINYQEGKSTYLLEDFELNDESFLFYEFINELISDNLEVKFEIDFYLEEFSPTIVRILFNQKINAKKVEDSWFSKIREVEYTDFLIYFPHFMTNIGAVSELDIKNYNLKNNILEIKNLNEFEIDFYTIRGNLIYKAKNQRFINLESLITGIYFAIIRNNKNIYLIKGIKL